MLASVYLFIVVILRYFVLNLLLELRIDEPLLRQSEIELMISFDWNINILTFYDYLEQFMSMGVLFSTDKVMPAQEALTASLRKIKNSKDGEKKENLSFDQSTLHGSQISGSLSQMIHLSKIIIEKKNPFVTPPSNKMKVFNLGNKASDEDFNNFAKDDDIKSFSNMEHLLPEIQEIIETQEDLSLLDSRDPSILFLIEKIERRCLDLAKHVGCKYLTDSSIQREIAYLIIVASRKMAGIANFDSTQLREFYQVKIKDERRFVRSVQDLEVYCPDTTNEVNFDLVVRSYAPNGVEILEPEYAQFIINEEAKMREILSKHPKYRHKFVPGLPPIDAVPLIQQQNLQMQIQQQQAQAQQAMIQQFQEQENIINQNLQVDPRTIQHPHPNLKFHEQQQQPQNLGFHPQQNPQQNQNILGHQDLNRTLQFSEQNHPFEQHQISPAIEQPPHHLNQTASDQNIIRLQDQRNSLPAQPIGENHNTAQKSERILLPTARFLRDQRLNSKFVTPQGEPIMPNLKIAHKMSENFTFSSSKKENQINDSSSKMANSSLQDPFSTRKIKKKPSDPPRNPATKIKRIPSTECINHDFNVNQTNLTSHKGVILSSSKESSSDSSLMRKTTPEQGVLNFVDGGTPLERFNQIPLSHHAETPFERRSRQVRKSKTLILDPEEPHHSIKIKSSESSSEVEVDPLPVLANHISLPDQLRAFKKQSNEDLSKRAYSSKAKSTYRLMKKKTKLRKSSPGSAIQTKKIEFVEEKETSLVKDKIEFDKVEFLDDNFDGQAMVSDPSSIFRDNSSKKIDFTSTFGKREVRSAYKRPEKRSNLSKIVDVNCDEASQEKWNQIHEKADYLKMILEKNRRSGESALKTMNASSKKNHRNPTNRKGEGFVKKLADNFKFDDSATAAQLLFGFLMINIFILFYKDFY